MVNLETITNHNHRGIWGWFDTRRDMFQLIIKVIMLVILVNSPNPDPVLIAMFMGWIFHFHHGLIHVGWMV